MNTNLAWWQKAVFYQVYVRSFMDSNGDGIGDIPGIIDKLDYFQWLGVDALWLSPTQPSPMADFGYDISDFKGIDPIYGSMEDMDRLIREAHKRQMKIVLDFVPNHTSDEHPWFTESRSSRRSSKRDWYIWHDAKPDGSPPNNWGSVFGGSGWTWDEKTKQYYFHSFLEKQPELNWWNPQVRKAVYDVMHFWLKRGVDGFRIDAMWHLIKDQHLRNNPFDPGYSEENLPYDRLAKTFSVDQAETHEILCEMRRVVEKYKGPILLGELYLSVQRLVSYYGYCGAKEVDMPLNFHLIHTPWNAREVEKTICSYEGLLPSWAWPNWSFGNHDMKRMVSRIGRAAARVAAMLQFSLRGTPTIYYGEEIGMEEVPVPPECMKDPQRLATPDNKFCRDSRRTPMQWKNEKGGGFTSGEPWLPLPKRIGKISVEAQKDDGQSLIEFYRRLIELRKREMVLVSGVYMPLPVEGNILAFRREGKGRRFLVVLNLGHRAENYEMKDDEIAGTVVLGTKADREGKTVRGRIRVRGDEGMIIRLLDK